MSLKATNPSALIYKMLFSVSITAIHLDPLTVN